MLKWIQENVANLLFLGFIVIFVVSSGSDDSENSTTRVQYSPETNYNYTETHDEEVEEYKEKPDGTYTVEACNQSSGNCYDLDADIYNGVVDRIYFNNGGHLDLDGAELDEDGYGSGESFTASEGYDYDSWDIYCYDC